MRIDIQKGICSEGSPGGDVTVPFPGQLVRSKPYKAACPEHTVQEIQAELTRLGLVFVEQDIDGELGRYSCCLRLVEGQRGEPVFQTMGKGRTNAYARASAYGEMIERLQNLAFYTTLVYSSEPETDGSNGVKPFKYYPDEKRLAGEELRHGISRLSRNDPTPKDFLLTEEPLGVPFWNVFGARIEHLPFRALQVIVGSNGMCSGNTPAEALIHGICEVFERHVLKQLFLSACSPPDVPLELFVGHDIYEDLRDLAESHRYKVRVKDCSLGLRLPVLGLLIQDAAGCYAFHLGSDPSPVTALERCFTEMCQGGLIRFKDPRGWKDPVGDGKDSEFRRTQLHLNIRSYDGHWPPALRLQEPDYAFEGFERPVSVSDELDLKYVLEIVKATGWELLIRDNSFLGFPSYHVYIPGISEMTNALDNDFAKCYLAFDRHMPVLTNPAGATLARRQEAVCAMEQYAAVAPTRQFRAADYLMHYPQHPLAGLSQDALQEFLLQPATPGDLPPCFDCAACRCASRCNHSFLSVAWSRLKQAMASGTWIQSNLRNVVQGRNASAPLFAPGR